MSAAVAEGNERKFLPVELTLARRGDGCCADGEPEAHEDRLDHLRPGNRGNDRRLVDSDALYLGATLGATQKIRTALPSRIQPLTPSVQWSSAPPN